MNDNKKKKYPKPFFIVFCLCLILLVLFFPDRNQNQTNEGSTLESDPSKKELESKKELKSFFQDTIPPYSEITKAVSETTHYTTETASTDSDTGVIETMNPLRVTYQPDFYYEPLSEEIKAQITGISYQENTEITYDDLSYLSLLYIDFSGEVQTGELICNKAIAPDLIEIFYELYTASYQLERVCLVDEYQGDDELSMLDNNTSAFNYRTIAGTSTLSKHALGLAIDINPFYNPYVTNLKGPLHISPEGSEVYANRSKPFPHKIDENDLCYKLMTEHGFTWGGLWKNSKDYQHFQKAID